MSTAAQLITAAEYAQLADPGHPTELVQGEVVDTNMAAPRHGQICSRVNRIVGAFVDNHRLGHVVTNDTGIITQRDPDTVRGGDVWFVSYEKVPPGPLPDHYLEVAPEIVFEVLSPHDRRARLLMKISEYLEIGVQVVCVLDPETETAHLYYPNQMDLILTRDDQLTFPGQLPEFQTIVRDLFA